jgi:uncharacterized membrane protein YedE/YeeE
MQEPDIASIQATVVSATFAVCLILGALMQRSHFCTMGAVSDIVNMGDWTRMRMWLCAIGVAIAGTQTLGWAGIVDPDRSFYAAPAMPLLSHLIGGLMFGFGMVLASGCGSKTLLRVGGGSLKSLVVLLVLGLFAYMTMRGVFGVFRVQVLDAASIGFAHGQDLPRLIGGGDAAAVAGWRLGLGLAIGATSRGSWAERSLCRASRASAVFSPCGCRCNCPDCAMRAGCTGVVMTYTSGPHHIFLPRRFAG